MINVAMVTESVTAWRQKKCIRVRSGNLFPGTTVDQFLLPRYPFPASQVHSKYIASRYYLATIKKVPQMLKQAVHHTET